MGERNDEDLFLEAMMSLNIRPEAKAGGPKTRARRPPREATPGLGEAVSLEDEDALFEAAMAEAGRAAAAPPATEAPAPTAPAAPPRPDLSGEDALFEQAMTALSPPPAEPDPTGPRGRELPATVTGTPKSLRRRIRSGEIEVTLELDLHGLKRDEARLALERFVKQAVADGAEVARIITGRGLHSAQQAVLKDAAREWLDGDLRAWVHLVVRAPQSHGGEGVIYVFFRRFRPSAE